MTPQTPEQKAEQAWRDNAKIQTTHIGEYMDGHRDTLSALKREIENRIDELSKRKTTKTVASLNDRHRLKAMINENKRFLKLIGEVKP